MDIYRRKVTSRKGKIALRDCPRPREHELGRITYIYMRYLYGNWRDLLDKSNNVYNGSLRKSSWCDAVVKFFITPAGSVHWYGPLRHRNFSRRCGGALRKADFCWRPVVVGLVVKDDAELLEACMRVDTAGPPWFRSWLWAPMYFPYSSSVNAWKSFINCRNHFSLRGGYKHTGTILPLSSSGLEGLDELVWLGCEPAAGVALFREKDMRERLELLVVVAYSLFEKVPMLKEMLDDNSLSTISNDPDIFRACSKNFLKYFLRSWWANCKYDSSRAWRDLCLIAERPWETETF